MILLTKNKIASQKIIYILNYSVFFFKDISKYLIEYLMILLIIKYKIYQHIILQILFLKIIILFHNPANIK